MQVLDSVLARLTHNPSPSSRLPSKQHRPPALRESAESKGRLDALILGCFAVQKLYGRDPGSIGQVNEVFHAVLGKYPADKAIRAFETWVERSQEFPTPADIVSLIRRNGKAPMTKEIYISISKKEPELRTGEDWAYLRAYEREQAAEEWGDDGQAESDEHTLDENVRLRGEVMTLRDENRRLADLLHEARVAKRMEPPKPSHVEKVKATIAAMREMGCPESDIMDFEASQGVV